MEKKLYCFKCNEYVDVIKSIEENEYIIRKRKVKVKEEVFICPYCKNEILSGNLDNSLYMIYNEYLKLYELSFDKLKKIRNSYDLSQELFAIALGWSKKTITRYENADSLPTVPYISIYKKIENNKLEFINILKNNKDTIPKDIYYKIYNRVMTDVSLKTINVFLYVLKDNYLTKTQIMKNMFAIDFESYKEIGKSITDLSYAHGTYGPIIDKKDDILNFLIRENYIELVNDENDNSLFKPIQECDIILFNKDEINIIKKVVNKLKGKEAVKLTNWSHQFKGWIETKNGEKIDYSYSESFDLDKGW